MSITQERLKELVSYNHLTGDFTRLSTGELAGNKLTGGYLRMRLDGKTYLCHRLAWLYMFGHFPQCGIDHKNNKTDQNNIENLRLANHSQNGQNLQKLRGNSSGFPGIKWDRRNKKWRANIKLNGKSFYIGLFEKPEEASAAYLSKKREMHPYFQG